MQSKNMALSTLAKEQENFLRYAILIVDHTKEALQDLIELNLKNKHLTFEEFLNKNKHEIYHLCYDFRCCQCLKPPPRRKRIIIPPQLELLFDKYNKLPSHKGTGHNDFCCSYAKVGITSQVLDLSLARCFLVNCCLDVFWYTCLTSQDQTLEKFLDSNKHIIYHLWKNNQNCCQCPSGFIFPCDRSIITEHEWKSMFSSRLSPCENDRKRMSIGSSSVCSVGATPGIKPRDINPEIQRFILQKCSHISKAVDFLVEQRNSRFAHVPEARIPDSDFRLFLKDIENHLLGIARVCGKETHVKKILRDLHLKPLSLNMLRKYEKQLHQNTEAINKNINLQHRTTRQSIPRLVDKSSKIRRIEERVDALETSVAKITEEVKDLSKNIKEQSKRQRLIGETLAEIDCHRKDQAYTEIKAVAACVQILDNSKVLILSGGQGSGKSRNSLEILRQLREKDQETDVIKLKKFTEFTDITDRDKMTIVLFEDVFGRTRKQFSEDTDVQILDSVNSYIDLGIIKVIFVMRNTVKQECQSVLSSHEIFCKHIAYLDLSSKEFDLSLKEKEQIFINYCTKNRIEIIYTKEPFYPDAMEKRIDKIKVSIVDEPDVSRRTADNTCIVVNSWSVKNMITSDPYQGYPQSCRLFTQNKKITMLGAPFFKYPSKNLLQEVDNMRREGIDNDVKGLKYVILVYILLNQDTSAISIKCHDHEMLSINENNIDVQAHQQLFNECYNKYFGLKLHDIIYLYDELSCKYLIRKENKIYFQHRALKDSVLISYCKINQKAIIPLLSIDHMIDIVRTQNHMEDEEETVIKISKIYYPELAVEMISSIYFSQRYGRISDRWMESKIMSDNDEDLIYEVISFINNEFDTSLNWHLFQIESYIYHYFPLYLLRNIGKLDDKTLTVNHTKNQMLISVTIKDKNVSLCVDPSISLKHAFQSKYIDIIKWLLKNTDHSLLNFTNCVTGDLNPDRILEYTKLLLQNVKHDMLDMTQLFIDVCCSSNNKEKHAIDWMVDNVDNSLIDYLKCFDEMLELDELETFIDSILYIVKKTSHVSFDINNLVYKSCRFESADVLIKVLQSVDPELFEKEELINTMIHNFDDYDEEDFWNKIVELISPWIKHCDINTLIEKADNCRWYRVLEFLITHVSDLSIDILQLIEKIFTYWDEEEDEDWENDDQHIETVFRLLLKHHTDSIGVAELIMEKACHVGSNCVVEELLLDKFDNISYYLKITLNKCLSRQLDGISISNDGDYGKLLLLFLQKVNTKFIDLDSLMSDLCNIGHSSAVLWLLENKHSHSFDLKNIMNKASYHGNRELVEYLKQKYKAGNFDYKTAMIKACRNSKEETLDVCKWLWGNIDRNLFNMKVALNNASRYDNTAVVGWILKDVDAELFDTENALFCACEHGSDHTVMLLLDESGINTFNLQYAITVACRNENNGYTIITKLLYERADKSTIDIHAVFSVACKTYRSDIVQWIIETCDQTETRDGNKHSTKSLDKNVVDMDRALTCIINMVVSDSNKENHNETKKQLVWLILNQCDPKAIYMFELLTETCKNDWIDIFQWILGKVAKSDLNIGEIINLACHNGAYKIVKWSLENINIQLLDADNVMIESCGSGWLECLVLIQTHCNQYNLHAAMVESCTYGRLDIVKWLLQNYNYKYFNLPLLLKETARNGWTHIFSRLITHFQFYNSDLQIATKEALINGNPKIIKSMLLVVGRDALELSKLSTEEFADIKNETVVNFILRNFNLQCLDLAKILTNACKFGWKNTASFIIDNDSNCLCDSALGLIDISSFITGKHVNCLCDFTSAFNTACMNGEAEIVQLLIKNVTHKIFDVQKAMLSTCIKGWEEIAVLLLDNFEHTQLDICNALIEACRHGEIYVVQAILRKIEHNLLDIKTALNGACENHMNEELVLWILKNIDREQLDLSNVRRKAVRHKWRTVQLEMPEVDIEGFNQIEHETETDYIVIP